MENTIMDNAKLDETVSFEKTGSVINTAIV